VAASRIDEDFSLPELGAGERPAIEARDLRKRFGDFEAVRGVSFDVMPGETFGFLGPNGAGKSTTISMLCTLLKPSGGTALVAGHDVVAARAEVRRRIGLVFQDTTLDDYLTAAENLRFHAELYGVPKRVAGQRVQQVLEMVGLWDRRDSITRTFSGGMKRRLEIARGLLHSPRVLFLDEPTVGLDPQTRLHIWNYINELKRREQITMFLTTHYMEEAEFCDRIAIMDNGVIVVTGTPEELKAGIGKDRVELRTDDDELARRRLKEVFGLEAFPSYPRGTPASGEDGLTIHVEHGERFIPQLFASLGVGIQSVSVARPTLDDVFMEHTGRTIRDAESSAPGIRNNPFMRARAGGR
jgi:ABC-2 type transport system ATP-binding protein